MALRLNGSTSGYVELNAPAVAGSTSLTVPFGVIQVVQDSTSTQSSVINTTAWQDGDLSATITPVAAGSRILVIISQYLYSLNGGISYTANYLKLRRGTTDLTTWKNSIYVNFGGGAHAEGDNTSVNYLDTPTYTVGNSISYNTQVRADNTTNSTLTWNTYHSTLTLMEIAA